MTSPRLSTVGTISAIEKALAMLDKLVTDRYMLRCYISPTEQSEHALIAAARAEHAELRAQPEQGREVKPEAESLLAGMLMMQRRGNPDMGGPNWADKRNAKDILEGFKSEGFRIVREMEPRR